MKNEVISMNTKKRLSHALKKAMKKKAFSKITISELIKDCDINRNTFYYHFNDIYDLLRWTFEQEAIDVIKKMNPLENTRESIIFVLDYIDNNKYVINCALDSIGRDELKTFLYNDISSIVISALDDMDHARKTPLNPDDKEFFASFVTEGMAGCIVNYVKMPTKWSREKIVDLMMHLVDGIFDYISREL